jgi:tRNA nucleotidyltransferase/poly(A) polymerase
MHDLSKTVSSHEVVRRIKDLLPEGTYLVGGCIRDMLLGRDPLDLDLVAFAPVADLARSVAGRLEARPFWMDEKRGVMRIALKKGANIDISEPKGTSIEEDLASRDLTINALAWDLPGSVLVDPLSGMEDLTRGLVRLISEENLIDDPLRAVRAVRFAVTLGFAVEAETSRMIKKHAGRVSGVSGERLRREVASALGSGHGAVFFRLLAWNGLLPVLFAPCFSDPNRWADHAQALFLTVIPACQELDGIMYACEALMPGSSALLAQETEAGVQRGALLRLAAFLLGIEDMGTREPGREHQEAATGETPAERAAAVCAKLRFSSRSTRMVRTLVATGDRSAALLAQGNPRAVEMHRFCDELGDFVPEALMLSLSRGRAPGSALRQTAVLVWEYCRNVYGRHKDHPLVSGTDVLEVLGVPAGPEVGRWLRAVEEERARGGVRTRDEALEFLRRTAG